MRVEVTEPIADPILDAKGNIVGYTATAAPGSRTEAMMRLAEATVTMMDTPVGSGLFDQNGHAFDAALAAVRERSK